MSPTFKALLEKELKGKIRENSQEAVLLSSVKLKAENLKATFEMRTTGEMSEDTVQGAEIAADEMIDSLIEDMLNGVVKDSNKKSKTRVRSVKGLRTRRGTIISALNLQTLLNLTLQEHIKTLSGSEGRLNYITGRFASSAKVLDVSEDSEGNASLMFTYMLYPYEVFENDNNRQPSAHIDKAIDLALETLLHQDSIKRLTTREFIGG